MAGAMRSITRCVFTCKLSGRKHSACLASCSGIKWPQATGERHLATKYGLLDTGMQKLNQFHVEIFIYEVLIMKIQKIIVFSVFYFSIVRNIVKNRSICVIFLSKCSFFIIFNKKIKKNFLTRIFKRFSSFQMTNINVLLQISQVYYCFW